MLGETPLFLHGEKLLIYAQKKIRLKDSVGNQESDLEVVNDERRPAAWAGRISPNVDMAAADLSLNMPTCPSVSIDPSFNVLSPNMLLACMKDLKIGTATPKLELSSKSSLLDRSPFA